MAAAGALVAVFNGVGLFTTIGVPLVADRLGARRAQLVLAAVVGTLGFVGIALVPDPAYLWVAILGLALGAIFPLVLTLPLDVADDAVRVGSVAALMLLGGYVLSSIGPVLLGAARDVTGSFEASLWLLALVGVVLAAACLLLSRSGSAAGSGAPEPGRGATARSGRASRGWRAVPGTASPPGPRSAVHPDLGGLRDRRVQASADAERELDVDRQLVLVPEPPVDPDRAEGRLDRRPRPADRA